MKKTFFIIYAVDGEKNQLFICCYHEKMNGIVAMKKISPVDKTQWRNFEVVIEELAFEDNDDIIFTLIKDYTLNAIKNNILDKLAESQKELLNVVFFSADLNLGFNGAAKFPTFLYDTSLKEFFKKHPVTQHAVIDASFDTHESDIVEKAQSYYDVHHSSDHVTKFPGSPHPRFQSKVTRKSSLPTNFFIEKLDSSERRSPDRRKSMSSVFDEVGF